MADTYSIVRPLTTRHVIGTALAVMQSESDAVPIPHGYINMFEKTILNIGFDGPFIEIITRLKPLFAEYPKQRFYGDVAGIDPDGNDEDDNATDDSTEDKNNTSDNENVDTHETNPINAETKIVYRGTWYWVSLVPYRIFETFCLQHIHDWWYRYNLTRNTLEFVTFDNNVNAKEIITMQTLPDGDAENIDAWNVNDTDK